MRPVWRLTVSMGCFLTRGRAMALSRGRCAYRWGPSAVDRDPKGNESRAHFQASTQSANQISGGLLDRFRRTEINVVWSSLGYSSINQVSGAKCPLFNEFKESRLGFSTRFMPYKSHAVPQGFLEDTGYPGVRCSVTYFLGSF